MNTLKIAGVVEGQLKEYAQKDFALFQKIRQKTAIWGLVRVINTFRES